MDFCSVSYILTSGFFFNFNIESSVLPLVFFFFYKYTSPLAHVSGTSFIPDLLNVFMFHRIMCVLVILGNLDFLSLSMFNCFCKDTIFFYCTMRFKHIEFSNCSLPSHFSFFSGIYLCNETSPLLAQSLCFHFPYSGETHSLKVEKILYQGKSPYQEVLIFEVIFIY